MSSRGEHVGEDGLAFGDIPSSESGKTKLHDGSVVEDLSGDIGLSDRILQMRHEEQISSLVISAVGGLVVDVGKDGSSSQQWSVRVVDVDTKQVNQFRSVSLNAEWGDGRLQAFCGLGDG